MYFSSKMQIIIMQLLAFQQHKVLVHPFSYLNCTTFILQFHTKEIKNQKYLFIRYDNNNDDNNKGIKIEKYDYLMRNAFLLSFSIPLWLLKTRLFAHFL